MSTSDERQTPILTNLEYETQHFGCSSDDVVKATVSLMQIKIKDNIHSLLRTVEDSCQDDEKLKVRKISNTLNDMYNAASEIPLENLKENVKKLFKIPSYVLLPEDQDQKTQYSLTDIEKVDEEIKSLVERLQKATYVEATLERSYAETKDILHNLDNELNIRNLHM